MSTVSMLEESKPPFAQVLGVKFVRATPECVTAEGGRLLAIVTQTQMVLEPRPA